jgi:S-DNA-T family DNA segregation ATPase FtsK/SpoIIIE
MMVERAQRLDPSAVALLAGGLLVAVAVFSHEPGRSPGGVLGPVGSWLAANLFEALGQAVYALLASWFLLVMVLFLRRGKLIWTARLLGWILLIPCLTVVFDGLGPDYIPGPICGSGGSVGAWLHGWLAAALPPPAGALIFGTAVIVAACLAADILLWRLANRGWRIIAALFTVLRRGVVGLYRSLSDDPQAPPSSALALSTAASVVPAVAELSLSRSDPPPGGSDIPIHHHDHHLNLATDQGRFDDYELPPLSLLDEPQPFPYQEHDQSLRDRAALLEKTFKDFSLNVRVVGINTGPVVTQYEVALETGLRVHKVTVLADDLALNLKVPSVRIVAPIPNKNTVGIEIPNEHRAVVRLKEVMLTSGKPAAKCKIPLFLGKDTEGRPLFYDLAEMPHLLIAGRTGTGKSVCMNAIILSMLMTRRPDEVKMIMIDPKMLELSEYGRIPHLMHPVVKDMKKAEAILAWAVDKMEERYDILSRARVRSIAGYNELSPDEILRRVQPADDEERRRIPDRMPYIVIFVDEMNDLMMVMKKEVEGHIIRLAQKSRAAGIHLVVATQKPTVDVITGLIKSNLPARICFKVTSRSDSRVVLDEMGADKLLGKGDMLFLQPGTSILVRSQGTYASDEEISRVVKHLECDPCYAQELVQLGTGDKEDGGSIMDNLRSRDELYEQAIEIVLREGRGSVSLLQRALGIGYGRAARLIDFMAEDGIVGDYNGSQAREVLYTPEEWGQARAGCK